MKEDWVGREESKGGEDGDGSKRRRGGVSGGRTSGGRVEGYKRENRSKRDSSRVE